MTNNVMHWQLLSSDPDTTAAFYGTLFDWEVSAANGLGYREVKTGGAIDGGIWPTPPTAPEAVQIYVEVDDIDAVLTFAVELGGEIVMPKQVLPDGDVMAIASDPLGRSFGLMARRQASFAPGERAKVGNDE